MAGTPDADWLKAMRSATVDVVVHCSVALSGTTMDFHNWASGGLASSITGDPLLSSMTSISQRIDPLVRVFEGSEISLELIDDGKIRGLVSTQNFLDKKVTVKVGAASLGLSDFVIMYVGKITRLTPREGAMHMKIISLDTSVRDEMTLLRVTNQHPFEVLKTLLEDSGVDSSDIDSTSFTPATETDISHYVFNSRVLGSAKSLNEGMGGDYFWRFSNVPRTRASTAVMMDWTWHHINVAEFFSEILRLTRSTLFVNLSGKVAIKHFDSSEAVAAHLTVDDYRDFEQLEEDVDVVNKVNCTLPNTQPQTFSRSDATSITAYGERPMDLGVRFLAARAKYYESSAGPEIAYTGVPGFAGTRGAGADAGASQDADAKISSDRPSYWLHRQEVVKSTGAMTFAGSQYDRDYDNAGATVGGAVYHPRSATLTSVVTRPFVGNECDEGHWDFNTWDLTATFDYCDYVLNRFSNTAPKIRVSTTLEFSYLELGDLISLDNDVFMCPELGLDGLDSSVKFEIIEREVEPLGDSVGVTFTMAYATKTSPPSVSLAAQIAEMFQTNMPDSILGAIDAGFAVNSVISGLDISTGSSLQGDVAGGQCSAGQRAVIGNQATQTFTATASKDNYVGIDVAGGQIMVTPVAVGAAEPSLGPTEVRLGRARTNASAITGVVDLRRFGHISANQVDKDMIAPGMTILWNPSFDVWTDTGKLPTAWDRITGSGTVGTDYERSDTSKAGRYSFKILNTSATVQVGSAMFPVNPLNPYRAKFWLRQDTSTSTVTVSAYWFQADRTASSTSNTTIYSGTAGSTGSWVQKSAVLTVPSDAYYCSIVINQSGTPGGTPNLDEFSFAEEPVSFSVYGAATAAPGTKSVFQVKYNQESYDYGANYDHSGNYDFEAPGTGVYEFSAAVQGVYVGSFTYLRLMLYKNGSVFKEVFGGARTSGTLEAFAAIESGPVELEAGDLITVHMHPEIQTSYTLNTGTFQTWFNGLQIS